MLWTDERFVTVNDLTSLDAELPDVCQTEGVVLDGDNGIIQRAKSDAQSILSRFMSFSGLSPTDLTVRNVNLPFGLPDLRFNYAGFEQVVVSGDTDADWSALKNWVANFTLRLVYQKLSNKNGDRYSDRYESANDAILYNYWPQFKRRGLPISFNPLSCPGAIQMRVGFFTANNLTLVAGAGTLNTDIQWAITWVGNRYVSPTNKFNNESYRSALVPVSLVTGQVARISIAGLTPPNGQQAVFTMSSCRYSPGVAVGWNVWAGLPDGTMYRQNVGGVLPLTQQTFTSPGNPILSGEQLDLGQYEDIVLEVQSQILRAG